MSGDNKVGSPMTTREFIDALIGVGLVGVMLVLCFRIFTPFMGLMIWALILAVTLYPLHQKLARKLGGKDARAATLIVLVGFILLGAPCVLLASSLATELTLLHDAYANGTLALPDPKPGVKDWPIIGDKVYSAWDLAAHNMPKFIEDNHTVFENLATGLLAQAKSMAGGVLVFLGSVIVSGILMAYGRSGSEAVHQILRRIAGPENGPEVHTLATMTTRSVAAGVLGVAVIQGMLMGVLFLLAGVPAAGLLALAVLLLTIMQLPTVLVSIPVIIWLLNSADPIGVMTIVWCVALFVGGFADNALKPLLLGRGVDAPMPVILIGALGGMVSAGFVGLFTGAVTLAVGYRIFMRWVESQHAEELMEDLEEQAQSAASKKVETAE